RRQRRREDRRALGGRQTDSRRRSRAGRFAVDARRRKSRRLDPRDGEVIILLTHRPTLVALLVAGAFFMENMDGTVIATALPQMALSFGANPVDLNLGITAYLLTLAVFIPVSGWIADRLGARTVFALAIALFTF